MKRFLLFIFLLVLFIQLRAATYYSQTGQTNPNALSSWDINPGGSGGAPLTFTNPGDLFIIQNGHTMTTTATWTVGGSGSILNIKNGGTLQGNHSILLTGTFQIDPGGTYIHNNNGSVAQGAGMSIFSGAESFASTSNFEIRNWESNIIGLPNSVPGIIWGNLIINMQVSLAGAWNWNFADGQTLRIDGNLDIRSTYVGSAVELRLTPTGTHTINIGGNFLLSGTKTQVAIKKNNTPPLDGYTTMQVNGNVSLTGFAQLDLGINTTSTTAIGLYELRFKGNFSAVAGTTVTSTSSTPYLAANGTSVQTLSCIPTMSCNFRVALGATVNLISSLTTGAAKKFAVCGTYNDNGNGQTFGGPFEVAGGIVNASGAINMGSNFCRSCLGTGTYNSVNATWCTLSGTKGRINFNSNTITFNRNAQAKLDVGINLSTVSDGEVYLTNSIIGFTGAGSTNGAVSMFGPATVLSLNGTSYITGTATFTEFEGTLRIGSADGITTTGNPNGNIQVGGTRGYNGGSTATFEYFGSSPQVTGDGLPVTIAGKLKINNTAGIGTSGVTLSQNTSVSGVLDLTSGKLTTSISGLLNITDNATAINYTNNSFVFGPMKKTGDETFIFPVGEGAELHTIELFKVSGDAATDEFQVQYFKANPQFIFIGPIAPGTDHMSALEYWMVNRNVGGGSLIKKVTLQATTYTDATDLTKLVIVNNPDNSVWQNNGMSTCTGVSSGIVTSNNVSAYGPFTFASTDPYPVNPLPINLISFDATKLTNTKASLNWELAACCSAAARFEIQRANAGRSFTSVGNSGGSTTNRVYNYTDNGLKNGINYYRLKMIDEDGKITYSRTVAVMNGVDGLLLTSLIPAMVSNSAILTIASSRQQKLDLIITDMQGRIVQKQNLTIGAGNTSIQLSTDRLAMGVYQLIVVSLEGKTNVIRFIKQ